MKILPVFALALGLATAQAAVVDFDLSPAGTDNAVGLSPSNEVPPATLSTGSGNEIGSGITLDTDTLQSNMLQLDLSIGYGSAFGFTDLTGPVTGAQIHGPASTDTNAPMVVNLDPLLVPATNPATGGSIVGTVTLTSDEASNLLAGLYYINIQTTNYPAGEIRGQLIPVNTRPTVVCPPAATVECTGQSGTYVSLTAQVVDEDGDALTVTWSVDGTSYKTNTVAAGTSTNLTDVSFDASYGMGSHTVVVSVFDGTDTVTCSTTVDVVDTTPPVIISANVTPDILWPPNHKFVPVQVSVDATDTCSEVSCQILSISSSQSVYEKGSGHTAPDWKRMNDGGLTAKLRAERSGRIKSGRTYTLVVACTDDSGNVATTNLVVLVPHDRRQWKALTRNSSVTPAGQAKGKGQGKGRGNANANGRSGGNNGNNGNHGNGNNGNHGNNGKGSN